MKDEDSKKAKAPAQKKEEKVVPPATGLSSKLKFPELPTKQAIAIPLVLLAISILIVGFTFATTGSPLHLGIDFKGGTMVTLKTDRTDEALNTEFGAYPIKIITHGSGGEKTLRFSDMSNEQETALAAYVNDHYPGSPIESIGSTFSAANQVQAVIAVLVAFAGMAITVFIIFRNPIPSGAVVMSAFADIMVAMALMNVFGVELTFGTLAALLMLIGYSVDTDILLTTKVLGERKYLEKKIATCRTTGLTMTGTAIVAFVVLYLVSTFSWVFGMSSIPVLSNISLVMIFGLLADLINTWFFNAGLLKWYMESPAGRAKYG
ncbi:MAG: Protein-export membrane protein SecF [Methanocella sp. PtaU1.Bin125]|nr:MAG: Protein-export membrane protein SecF [Methanocella sp. PtaU1.Bin125]